MFCYKNISNFFEGIKLTVEFAKWRLSCESQNSIIGCSSFELFGCSIYWFSSWATYHQNCLLLRAFKKSQGRTLVKKRRNSNPQCVTVSWNAVPTNSRKIFIGKLLNIHLLTTICLVHWRKYGGDWKGHHFL